MLKNTAIKDAQFQSAVMCTVLCLDVLTTANNSLLFLQICSQATGIKKYPTHISESLATNNTFHVDVLSDGKSELEYLAAKAETATQNVINMQGN